jgi:F420-non-reducing hydrogenase iron-sulfur subunit
MIYTPDALPRLEEITMTDSERFEPVIIGFTCNWCSYRAADLAGTARIKYPPNVRLIRLMCSGRLDPTFVLKALSNGADGVMITGCHPGDCHYLNQNYKAMRRYRLLRRILAQFGIEPQRVQLVWASAAEGLQFAEEVTRITEEIRALGPLNWPTSQNLDEYFNGDGVDAPEKMLIPEEVKS